MKKFYYVIFAIISFYIFYGCSTTLNYKTTNTLKERYPYSQKAGDLIFFYDVKQTEKGKLVELNVKNVSNLFISNLVFDISEDGEKYSRFLYVGNIKNLNSKVITFNVDKKSEILTISYKYNLIKEDSFLGPDKNNNGSDPYEKSEKVTILLK